MIDLDNLERTLELANDYVDDGLHFLTEPVSYGELKLLVERLISAEKDAARYLFLRDEATDYHTGEIHGANEEDKDDLVDMFMEQLNDKVKQFERARSKMIRKPIDEAMQCNK